MKEGGIGISKVCILTVETAICSTQQDTPKLGDWWVFLKLLCPGEDLYSGSNDLVPV